MDLTSKVQNLGGKEPGWKFFTRMVHTILPVVQRKGIKPIVLIDLQRHFFALLSYMLLDAVLRQSHYIKIQRIIK